MSQRACSIPWAIPAGRAVAAAALGMVLAAEVPAAEIVIYGFERPGHGWVIPEWAYSAPDHVAEALVVSRERASEGQQALEVRVLFPADRWTCAYAERTVEATDWTPFGRLAVEVYLPPTAPGGLQARLILTVGEQWKWVEMAKTVPLAPGRWTTVTADLTSDSRDWTVAPDAYVRSDVRKLGIRIESSGGAAYRGSVFLDRVRLGGSPGA